METFSDPIETSSKVPENNSGHSPEVWLDEHGSILFQYAMVRVRDRQLAEDLVQETLCKAFAAIDKFRGDSAIRTWLFTILRNEISSFHRRGRREKESTKTESSVDLHQLLQSEMSPKQFRSNVEKSEFWTQVQGCFAEVPAHLLESFLQRLANPEKKLNQLCDDLDITPANYAVRLFRTRLLLRRCLEQRWFEEERCG